MEDLLLKDELEFLIQPEHFQSTFLNMGVLFSIGLLVLLWDMLSNPYFGFYRLMFLGLSACLLITIGNLFFFSTVLWTPITRETEEKTYELLGENLTAIPSREIRTGEYEIDWEMFLKNKTVAIAMIWYGAVTSVIFIFVTMMRSLGNSFEKLKKFGLLKPSPFVIQV